MSSTKLITTSSLPLHLVKGELKKVENQIKEQVNAFEPALEPYISYICNTSGKRIRPAISVLAGGAVSGRVSDEHVKIGVILELIHISTLVHDDIIDGAQRRRKALTPNAKWGNGIAVLLGDALFSHALLLATEFNDINVCRKVGRASREVCQGEVIQTQRRFDLSLTKSDYFKIIEMKTGALFAASASIACLLSGAPSQVQKLFYNFGMKIGVAYQIYDDCLDLVGKEENTGKTLRTDLKKGKLTLPLLNLLEKADPEQRAKLSKRIIEQQALDLPVLIGIADYEGAIKSSLNKATMLLNEARSLLAGLPENPWRSGLEQVTRYLDGLLKKCHC